LKRHILVLGKLGVSLALLGYLFSTTDLSALLRRVWTGDLLLMSVAVTLYILMLGLATWRWGLLLQAQGFSAPLRHLSASYLVASFFNNFLPSNIGVDVIRVRDSSRFTGSTTTSLAVVAIDRVLGFGALYVLAAITFMAGDAEARNLIGARPVIIGLGLVFAGLAYVFFRPGTTGRLMAALRLSRVTWLQQQFEVVQTAVRVYRERLGALVAAFAASIALQALLVLYFYYVAQALRIPLATDVAFMIVPLCTLVQAIPVSFNGWGLRESVFILYFAQVGLSRDSALAVSLVGAGLIVLLSLSGAVVWTSRSAALESA
jgi:uncharacterized protein (TIRG00374 family)